MLWSALIAGLAGLGLALPPIRPGCRLIRIWRRSAALPTRTPLSVWSTGWAWNAVHVLATGFCTSRDWEFWSVDGQLVGTVFAGIVGYAVMLF
jgi:hypothetical protein